MPELSVIDQNGTDLAGGEIERRNNDAPRTAEAAAPGFSLN